MGARPSSYAQGGGFLNGVDVTIVDYEFTDEFNGLPFKPGTIKNQNGQLIAKPHSLNCLLTVQLDGATEVVSTTLRVAGDFEAWTIVDNGHTIEPVNEGQQLSGRSGFGKFLTSLVHPLDGGVGFPEERLPETVFNFEAILGSRVRLVQSTDESRTKEFGKRKGKNGREYSRTDLLVQSVLGTPTQTAQSTRTSSRTQAILSAPPTGGNGAAAAELVTLARETVCTALADAGAPLSKPKLSLKVLMLLLQHPQREAIRKLIFSDDFLAAGPDWSYEPTDPDQLVTLHNLASTQVPKLSSPHNKRTHK